MRGNAQINSLSAIGPCGGIFADASHCWPFNIAKGNKSPDESGGIHATLKVNKFVKDFFPYSALQNAFFQHTRLHIAHLVHHPATWPGQLGH